LALAKKMKKKQSSKTFGDTATYISCTFVQYVSNQECAAVVCLRHYICQLFEAFPLVVADPDLQIREGGGHPDPSDKQGSPVSIFFFFGLKIWGAGPPGLCPGSATAQNLFLTSDS